MNYDDGIKEYADIAYAKNKEYCEKNGYDIRRYKKVYEPALEMTWQKIWLIKEVIESVRLTHTHVVWIDADAFFNPVSQFKLEDFLPSCNKFATFSEDVRRYPLQPYGLSLNCGVMIYKVCQESIDFFDKINEKRKVVQKYVSFHEQGTIIRMIQDGDISMKGIMFVPYNTIQTFPMTIQTSPYDFNPKSLVYHYAGVDNKLRIEIFRQIVQKKTM